VALVTEDFSASADALARGAEIAIDAARPPGWLLPTTSTGVVTVDAGPDGLPRVSVSQGWENLIAATDLSGEVTAAIGAFLDSRRGQPVEDMPPWYPDPDRADLPSAMDRINRALETAIARLERVSTMVPEEPQPAAENRTGQVKVFAGQGRMAVSVDPGWARGRSFASVSAEIDEVVHEAAEKAAHESESAETTDPLAVDPRAPYDYLRSVL
jgi:hypothetical protein